MMPGNAFAAFTPNLPSSDDKAFSLFLTYSFTPAWSLGGGLPAVPPPHSPPLGSNTLVSTPIAILIALRMEAIIIPCSQNRVRIFSANDVFLSSTLAIVSLKLVILLVSLLLSRLMLFCLADTSSFSQLILLLMSSWMPSSYSGLYGIP